MRTTMIFVVLAMVASGCFLLEQRFFPIWEPNYFDTPPTPPGPYSVTETRFEVTEGADGAPFGITIFEPVDAEGPRPVFIWVMGSNVQAYYHQSLHEILASWGYLVLVPDTRPLRFADAEYHNRLVLLAEQTLELALDGSLGVAADPERIAAGGYSIGGPLAAFLAARRPEVSGLVHWAPTGSPVWQGLSPEPLYAEVDASSLYLLGELDTQAPPEGGYPAEMQRLMPEAPFEVVVIEGATHHQFQQPTGADEFSGEPGITREEQHAEAILTTRLWLDELFGIVREK